MGRRTCDLREGVSTDNRMSVADGASIHYRIEGAGPLLFLVGAPVGVAGFAPLEAIHDAAHNTRHAISFPCH
jgi:cobalt transporter subunit CbtB